MSYHHVIPMEHDEWHSQGPFHRTAKRPLGKLESQHGRYTPRQPVLSCQSLDVDKSGSRTYRAKSTSAIIEEQHQLLHSVYMTNRAGKETKSPRNSRPTSQGSPHLPADHKKRRFLTINGSSRPWTSEGRPKSVKTTDTKKRRPHTTGGSGVNHKPGSTETDFKFKADPAIEASTKKFNSTNRRIKQLWRPESHNLDDGVFIRGRTDVTTPTSSTGNGQWLNFAGGDQQSSGLIQAFTSATRGRGDYYSIDGAVGTHVARHLRRGDKIRVGINGQLQSTDLRIKKSKKRQQDVSYDGCSIEEDPLEVAIDNEENENGEDPPPSPPGTMPPLSWSDQVEKTDAKVLQPSVPIQPKPRPRNNETHPVIFEKLISDDPAHLARDFRSFRGNNTWSTDGFAVRSRVKSRMSIDGATSQQITNISIDTKHNFDENVAELSVEDILAKRLQGSELTKDKGKLDMGIPNLTNIHTNDPRKKVLTPPTSARSGREEIISKPPSRMGVSSGLGFSTADSRSVRPLTAHSANNIDQNFDTFVVMSAVGNGKPASARSGCRAGSGKRPPPAKPSLHKSAAATGASIGGVNSNKGDAKFIQITHSLSTPSSAADVNSQTEERGLAAPTPISHDLSMAGDDEHEQDFSQGAFSDLDSDLEEAVREAEANNRDLDDFDDDFNAPVPQVVSKSPSRPISTFDADQVIEEVEAENEDLGDVEYAFDIPTAEEVEEEEIEDGLDKPSLHDRLVEQTADLLAGAIIGADLPVQYIEPKPASRQSNDPPL